jgi:hypothetical protein
MMSGDPKPQTSAPPAFLPWRRAMIGRNPLTRRITGRRGGSAAKPPAAPVAPDPFGRYGSTKPRLIA